MSMYDLTGVVRPTYDNVEKLQELSQLWEDIRKASNTARDDVERGNNAILDNQDGPVAQAFYDAANNGESIYAGLGTLSDAAQATADAHEGASQALARGLLRMDTLAARALVDYEKAKVQEVKLYELLGIHFKFAQSVIGKCREDLEREAESIRSNIRAEYETVSLPEPMIRHIDTHWEQEAGSVSPAVEDAWASYSTEERKKILQGLYEEECRERGIEPKEIEWDSEGNVWGEWDPDTQTLHLNDGQLQNPEMIGTAIHEVDHGRQFIIADEYNNLSDDEIKAIQEGRKPDPFEQYGSNVDQAKIIRDNTENYHSAPQVDPNDPSYEQSEAWRNYYYQPMEREARRAGMETVDEITEEDLERYLNG